MSENLQKVNHESEKYISTTLHYIAGIWTNSYMHEGGISGSYLHSQFIVVLTILFIYTVVQEKKILLIALL